MKRLIANWQTTGVGLTMIGGSIIHLVFAVRAGTATEGVWTASVSTIVGGAGLMLAGDASKSATKDEVQQVAQNAAIAIKSGDTAHLTNPNPTPPSELPH